MCCGLKTEKNRLIEMILLSIKKHMLKLIGKKIFNISRSKFFLSKLVANAQMNDKFALPAKTVIEDAFCCHLLQFFDPDQTAPL